MAWEWAFQERNWYARHGSRSRNWFGTAQVLAIALSGVTPVLVAWDDLSTVLKALPPALAAIILGASTVFGWRDNWVRFKQTAAGLDHELLSFATRATPYDSDDRDALIGRFVANTTAIVAGEYASWGRAVSQAAPPPPPR